MNTGKSINTAKRLRLPAVTILREDRSLNSDLVIFDRSEYTYASGRMPKKLAKKFEMC